MSWSNWFGSVWEGAKDVAPKGLTLAGSGLAVWGAVEAGAGLLFDPSRIGPGLTKVAVGAGCIMGARGLAEVFPPGVRNRVQDALEGQGVDQKVALKLMDKAAADLWKDAGQTVLGTGINLDQTPAWNEGMAKAKDGDGSAMEALLKQHRPELWAELQGGKAFANRLLPAAKETRDNNLVNKVIGAINQLTDKVNTLVDGLMGHGGLMGHRQDQPVEQQARAPHPTVPAPTPV